MTVEQKIAVLTSLGIKVEEAAGYNKPYGYYLTFRYLEEEFFDLERYTIPEIMDEIATEIYNKGMNDGARW
jgi:hypothetical protein